MSGLQWMHESGVLGVVLPELAATVDFSQEAGRRHKDVWEHTKQVVVQSVANPIVRWAALLHDIGKVPTRVLLPDGRVTFHRHAEVGARMWDPIARRLGFDKTERRDIRFLVLNHLRANAYDPGWTDAAVRRFDKEMGDHLDDLLELSCADVTSRRPGRRQEAIRNVEALRDRILAIRDLDARVPPLPPASATPSCRRSGFRPRSASAISASCAKTPSTAASSKNAATPRTTSSFCGTRSDDVRVRLRALSPSRRRPPGARPSPSERGCAFGGAACGPGSRARRLPRSKPG